MLGLRLDSETEAGLARAARREKRSKSEIARDALRDYLRRTDAETELVAAVKKLAAFTTDEDLSFIDQNQADLEGLLAEEEAAFRAGKAS